MTTAAIVYGSPATITMGLASLASTAGLLAGRTSAAVDNSADDAIDVMVGGKITTTATTTTNTQIQIWLIGSYDGTSYSGGATASDANFTPDTGAKNQMKLLTIIPNITTTAVTYTWGPFSVSQAFGGTMPIKWSVYVVHNTGTVLSSTAGNHEVKYTSVKYESA